MYSAKLRNLTGELVDVAVKSLRDCGSCTENDQKNFEREMAISADPQMKHPNIVQVYGIVKRGGRCRAIYIIYIHLLCMIFVLIFFSVYIENWIVMEYLPYGDLKSFLMVS